MVGVEIISFIPYFFLIPICIYGNIALYRHKSAMFIKKRSAFIVFGLNNSFLLVIVTGLNLQIGILYNIGTLHTRIAPHMLSWWCVLFFLISKNWIIYWRYKWQHITMQLKWQQLINPNVIDANDENQNNFFLKHNRKFGNISFVAKVVGTFALIIMVNNMLYIFKNETVKRITSFFDFLIFISATVAYAVIVCKTPKYEDLFFIHWESKIQSKVLLFCIISVAIVVVIVIMARINYMYISPVVVLSECTIFCIMSYISTFKIINKNSPNINTKDVMMVMVNMNSTSSNNKTNHQDIEIESMLSEAESINAFMEHLTKEFSMESLLALIEVSQFEDYLMNNNETYEIKEEVRNQVIGLGLIHFPPNIPKSAIVESKDDFEGKAYKIYQKYIAVGSEFELNIPGNIRKNWIRMVAVQWGETKMDVNDLMLLLEDTRREMRLLLTFSLTRFRKTNEFAHIIEIWNREMSQ